MTHCLVTFLGRVPRQEGGKYKEADYHFPDSSIERAAFFGFPLQKWLAADKLVIFGTAGSMWDHLFEGDIDIAGAEDERVDLLDNVHQDTLDRLAPFLAERLGCAVELTLISDALETADQTNLVKMLADAADDATHLSLDITHGYRHLPMLAFAAGLYLRVLKPELTIAGLWYGRLNTHTGEAFVHNMDGLLDIADWLSALQRHEWLGNYEGIAHQIDKSGRPDLARKLRDASHFLDIHQEYRAQNYIRDIRSELAGQPMTGPGELFQAALLDRMKWIDGQSRFSRQRQTALNALERKDYARAALIGREACITKWTEQYFGDSDDVFAQDKRSEAVNLFHCDGASAQKRAFVRLTGIRNVIAHANRPEHNNQKIEAAVKHAIKTRENLEQALREDFETLMGAT